MRFHLLGLPQFPIRKDLIQSAFIPLAYNMARMLKDAKHTVFAYAAAGSDLPCDELITVTSPEDLDAHFGQKDRTTRLHAASDNFATPLWRRFLTNLNAGLAARCMAGDIALLSYMHADQVHTGDALKCQYICGFDTDCKCHVVFPSYAWMHTQYGQNGLSRKPKWFDAVIPHYIDTREFAFELSPDPHFLFIGRLNTGKGEQILPALAAATNRTIHVAGLLHDNAEPPSYLLQHPLLKFIGPITDSRKRNEVMGKATAVIMPTEWVEPFGMVALESLACGTPVICSDWGGLTETVEQGVTGYRCRSLREFCYAVNHAADLSRAACRAAATRHDISQIWPKYEQYFQRLLTLYEDGWYTA
jgi:glycosyltransferase involved in cell wall biosynthesis